MARPIRLQLAGAHYLVTARAASEVRLFTDEQDRSRFIALLGRACQRYRWRCHAWCLGNDYYQVLIVIERPNLAAGMRYLNSVHSQTLNRRLRVCGPLFEGRYASTLVDPVAGLVPAITDVLREPVLAGLVEEAAAWPWSSYRATVAPATAPTWLAVRDVLARFGDDPQIAAAAFADALRIAPWPVDEEGIPRTYASPEYVARLVDTAQPDDEDDFIVLSRTRPPLREICDTHSDRRECMRVAYRSGYSQKEIARYFNVHTATVSRAVSAAAPWRRTSSTPLDSSLRVAD